MKWNWEHAKQMGLEFDEIVDEETGEIINYEGNLFMLIEKTLILLKM
jgi:hypothetical protein